MLDLVLAVIASSPGLVVGAAVGLAALVVIHPFVDVPAVVGGLLVAGCGIAGLCLEWAFDER